MNYDFIAIPDAEIPSAVEPVFQHVVTTYASETNKTVSMWRAVPDDLLDFKPHEKTNPFRTILVHQLLSERRFFGQFVGTQEPPFEELLPYKPISTSIYGSSGEGFRNWPLVRLHGGWNSETSSVAWSESGYGSSGDECCTPATTEPRYKRGCGWRGSTFPPSTDLPAM